MATPPKKPVDVQDAKRLLKSLEVTPVQTAAGMSTYLEDCADALYCWLTSSGDLDAASLRRHFTLLQKSLAFRHHVQAWYRERNAEDDHLYLFSQFDEVSKTLTDVKTGKGVSNRPPRLTALNGAVAVLSKQLNETARELAHRTLQLLFYPAQDDSYPVPVFKRNEDGEPSWPMNPFSVQSRENDYDNHLYGEWDVDPRMRYVPSRQDVATFRRWDRDFHPWGPKWRDWEVRLIQQCGLKASQCEELELPQILALLDHTPIENEMQIATSYLNQLATSTQSLEESEMDEGDKIWYRQCMAVKVSDLLLKVHQLDRRDLHVIVMLYPRMKKFKKFCAELIHQLGSVHEGREEVRQLLTSVASVMIPWCGEDAIQAKQALEQQNTGARSTTKKAPTDDYFPENIAALFDKSEGTVRRWCRAKKKPCHNAYKSGDTWRVPRADIDDAL